MVVDFANTSWWAGCELNFDQRNGILVAMAPRGTQVFVLYHGKAPNQTLTWRIVNKYDSVEKASSGFYTKLSDVIGSLTVNLTRLGYLKGN